MAHHEEQPTAIESVLELLSEHGLGGMAETMQTLLNEAMQLEPSEFPRAAPGERTSERTAYANNFKPKALKTRVGELALRVPQVRGLPGGSAPPEPGMSDLGRRARSGRHDASAERPRVEAR